MTDQVKDQDVELDEEIEEAHDPKNAEAQSVASVDAAEKKRTKAPKAVKVTRVTANRRMQKLLAPAMKAEDVDFNGDFSEDLNALVESEATLSEDFKAKTAVIFEAAVKSKLAEEIDSLETEYLAIAEKKYLQRKPILSRKLIATSTMWLRTGWKTTK